MHIVWCFWLLKSLFRGWEEGFPIRRYSRYARTCLLYDSVIWYLHFPILYVNIFSFILLLYYTEINIKASVILYFFDGASNFQNSGKILQERHTCITIGHDAKNVVSLFFSDVFLKIHAFKNLSNLAKKLCNVFGSNHCNVQQVLKETQQWHQGWINQAFQLHVRLFFPWQDFNIYRFS